MGSSSTIKLLHMSVVVMAMAVALPRNQAACIDMHHVYIYNRLEIGPTLTVHCWSKDNDLGNQDIRPKDFWSFSFMLDISGNTQFNCTFKWNDETHRFPIYDQMRDRWACQICNWTINPVRPCRMRDANNAACYSWQDSAK